MGVGDLESDQLPNMFSAVIEGESWGNGLGHEDWNHGSRGVSAGR